MKDPVIVAVDESLDYPNRVAVFAASYVVADRADEVRARLEELLLPGQRRLGWHSESAPRRLLALTAALSIPAKHDAWVTPAVAAPEYRRGIPTFARGGNGRWTLTRWSSLADLAGEVPRNSHILITDRGPHLNRRDRRNLSDVRANMWQDAGGPRSRGVTWEFVRPADDPLLWLPDLVGGAVLGHVAPGRCDLLTELSVWRERPRAARLADRFRWGERVGSLTIHSFRS